VEVVRFPYAIDGVEHIDDFGRSHSHADFYAAMRSGIHPTTMQVPRQAFVEVFRAHASVGRPLLYLGFSSALSGTYDIAWSAREEVRAEFPSAEIRLVDTRAASIAEGLLVYEAARQWRSGVSLGLIEEWVTERRPGLNGWFIVDDLDTLVRGGRLPASVAAAGTLLDVKPLLHVTADGRLEMVKRLRGRQKSMRALADLVAARIGETSPQTIAIGHGDCAEDAEQLRAMVAERVDADEFVIMPVGPVIGTHTGPGMLAVSFWGTA
jgi:DegV family protein with EDD domain